MHKEPSVPWAPDPVALQARKLRSLIETALQRPETESLVWQYAPAYRRFFQQHARPEQFLTVFDDDIQVWISLCDHIESQIYFQGMQEGDRGLTRLLKKLWVAGGNFVDIGANVGVLTLMAAKRLGSEGAVYAFEPVEESHRRLERNISANEFSCIQTARLALSNRCGTATIYVPEHNNKGMASLHEDCAGSRTETVTLSTLDRQIVDLGVTSIDWIKIDVEGHERFVLEGANGTIQRFHPMILLELSRGHLARAGTSPEEVVAHLNTLGYTHFAITDDGLLAPPNSISDHENACFVTQSGISLPRTLFETST